MLVTILELPHKRAPCAVCPVTTHMQTLSTLAFLHQELLLPRTLATHSTGKDLLLDIAVQGQGLPHALVATLPTPDHATVSGSTATSVIQTERRGPPEGVAACHGEEQGHDLEVKFIITEGVVIQEVTCRMKRWLWTEVSVYPWT